jgi:hypothetical protein
MKFSTNSNINISAKKTDGTTFWAMQINPAMYTARVNVAETYTQSYDFRSLDSTALGSRITTYS